MISFPAFALNQSVWEPVPKTPAPADPFVIATQREPVSLSKWKGKVVLLNFWATWCTACVHELPRLKELADRYEKRGVQVIAMSIDASDFGRVKDYVAQHKLVMPLLAQDTTREVYTPLQLGVVPVTYLIDRDGNIVARYVGDSQWSDAEHKGVLEKYLGQAKRG